jgi:hypothetical protein
MLRECLDIFAPPGNVIAAGSQVRECRYRVDTKNVQRDVCHPNFISAAPVLLIGCGLR